MSRWTRWIARSRHRFLTLLLVLLVLTACSANPAAPPPALNAPAPVAATKHIGTFSRIPGTIYLRAPITGSPSESNGFSFGSSGYTIDFAYNYIYLNTETEQTLQLLPDNNALILENTHIPEQPKDESVPWIIQWFLYSIVKSDTDNDRRLTDKDTKTIALSDSGGHGLTELIDGVSEIHGYTLRDPETLLLIYRKDGALFLSRINLPQRMIQQTTALPAFGPDIQLQDE